MGNTYSASSRRTLYTAAVAKFMQITKPQVMKVRDTLLPYITKSSPMIRRSHLEYSLDVANVDTADAKIFGHLFTLLDETGEGRVDGWQYIIGTSVLACKEDSLDTAIRFTLRAMDVKNQAEVHSRSAFQLLRGRQFFVVKIPWLTRLPNQIGICAVASCFGDTVPTHRQLYKMVDAIYDAVTMVSQEDDGISHDRFVRRLMDAFILKEFVLTLTTSHGAPGFVSTKNLLDDAGMSDDSAAEDVAPYERFLPSQYREQQQQRSVLSPQSAGVQSLTDDSLNSHMSSLMLKPLAQIPIS